MRATPLIRLSMLLAFAGIAACDVGTVDPDTDQPHLTVSGGDSQEGAPGQPLALPITVRLSGRGDAPIKGVEVTFSVTSGNGSVAPQSVVTDSLGIASTSWKLGTVETDSQRVEVRAVVQGVPVSAIVRARLNALQTDSPLIGGSDITFRGTIFTHKPDLFAWIEWGQDPTLTTFESSPSHLPNSAGAVSYTIQNPIRDATYYYRVVAGETGAEPLRGRIRSVTFSPPSAPTIAATTDAQTREFEVTVHHDGTGSPDEFVVDYRNVGDSAWTKLIDEPGTSVMAPLACPCTFTRGGLTPAPLDRSRTLEVRARFRNALGFGPAAVTTVNIPGYPAPSALTATSHDSARVVLTWVDNSTDEDVFAIERQRPGGGFDVIGNVGPNWTTYLDETALPGVRYVYRVRAAFRARFSAYSNEAAVTVAGTASNPALAVTNPVVLRDYTNPVTLYVSGSINPGALVAEGWMEWASDSLFTNPTRATPAHIPANAGDWKIDAVIPAPVEQTYYVRAAASNALGNVYGATVSYRVALPPAPTSFTVAYNPATRALDFHIQHDCAVAPRGLILDYHDASDTTWIVARKINESACVNAVTLPFDSFDIARPHDWVFRIRYFNEFGMGGSRELQTSTPELPAPSNPNATTYTFSNGSIGEEVTYRVRAAYINPGGPVRLSAPSNEASTVIQ